MYFLDKPKHKCEEGYRIMNQNNYNIGTGGRGQRAPSILEEGRIKGGAELYVQPTSQLGGLHVVRKFSLFTWPF